MRAVPAARPRPRARRQGRRRRGDPGVRALPHDAVALSLRGARLRARTGARAPRRAVRRSWRAGSGTGGANPAARPLAPGGCHAPARARGRSHPLTLPDRRARAQARSARGSAWGFREMRERPGSFRGVVSSGSRRRGQVRRDQVRQARDLRLSGDPESVVLSEREGAEAKTWLRPLFVLNRRSDQVGRLQLGGWTPASVAATSAKACSLSSLLK
jgi:hypothetical protein